MICNFIRSFLRWGIRGVAVGIFTLAFPGMFIAIFSMANKNLSCSEAASYAMDEWLDLIKCIINE